MTAHYEHHPLAALIPQATEAERESLTKDIAAHGIRHPITLYEGKILDGRHRHEACTALGIECPATAYTGGDPVAFVSSTNLARRHLTVGQRAMVADELANLGQGRPPGKDPKMDLYPSADQDPRMDLDPETPGPAMRIDQAAKIAHVSRSAVGQARAIQRCGSRALVDAVKSGDVTLGDAHTVVHAGRDVIDAALRKADDEGITLQKAARRIRRERRRQAQREGLSPQALPRLKYGLIVADPPWAYDQAPSQEDRVDQQYPTLTDSQIVRECPVHDLSADCAVLYLWATAPRLPSALKVMREWGFEYKTSMVWIKPSIGLGFWCRARHEHLLIGTKGGFKPPEMGTQPDSVIEAERTGHSVKPQSVYDMLAELYPDVARIDAFARAKREGWDTWGNEIR